MKDGDCPSEYLHETSPCRLAPFLPGSESKTIIILIIILMHGVALSMNVPGEQGQSGMAFSGLTLKVI